ncbi:TWiK family of potassium channels protein 18-like [Ctenocephalides felis]|uniref:TWiK family of potassium channels protein 18-like n=1 Tax=Ctenocephalides felis TaxID=7515 RepID=UPI000E6E20E6|nr:TWiK family of potassium channels protein 18-like [Ctenocephalides felis]
MEKDSGKYRYKPYAEFTKKGNMGGIKQNPSCGLDSADSRGDQSSCTKCLGRVKNSALWGGLLTNFGICALLLAYTLLGSFIFLAIEGDAAIAPQRSLASAAVTRPNTGKSLKSSLALNQTIAQWSRSNAEARARTVENIWDITVSLNILYRENWTRLAALEIARFQEELVKKLSEDLDPSNSQSHSQVVSVSTHVQSDYEWTFARAFLYSLTVLTTIGYGNVAPRTSLGRAVTLAYASVGIPLTLLYLSSAGGLLSRVARGVFSRALCCCLCSNCGYCCYDERQMADKERRMRKERLGLQEPFYLQDHSVTSPPELSGLSLLAPVLLCLGAMSGYICLGALSLLKLEGWSFIDGLYFCFMSLSTVGFGDMIQDESTFTTWFCSGYILAGMALTAMCFNVMHEEIVHRLKHEAKS